MRGAAEVGHRQLRGELERPAQRDRGRPWRQLDLEALGLQAARLRGAQDRPQRFFTFDQNEGFTGLGRRVPGELTARPSDLELGRRGRLAETEVQPLRALDRVVHAGAHRAREPPPVGEPQGHPRADSVPVGPGADQS